MEKLNYFLWTCAAFNNIILPLGVTSLKALLETGLGDPSLRPPGDPLPLLTMEKSSGIGGIALTSIVNSILTTVLKHNRHFKIGIPITNFTILNFEFGMVAKRATRAGCEYVLTRYALDGRSSGFRFYKAENL